MKRFKLFSVLVIVFCLTGGQSLFAQSKKEQKKQEVLDRIESGQYKININRAIPMQGKSINLTSLYSLELRGDSVISYLPYFGRAYNIPYGGGDGLRFEEVVSNYDLSFDKKGRATIKFTARTKEDNYTFNIQIFDNGSSSVHVTPVNRQSITFYGDLDTTGKKE